MKSHLQTPGQLLFIKLEINLDKIPIEQLAEYIAVEYYLTVEDEPTNVTNLEKVKRYLESFYHLCQVQDWQKAKEVIFIQLDPNINLELHEQLEIWGYYQKLIDIWQKLLGKLTSHIDIIGLRSLGSSSQHLNNRSQAIKYFEKSSDLAHQVGNYKAEVIALLNLGTNYRRLRKYHRAMEYYQQGLNLLSTHEIEAPEWEAAGLAYMGLIYKNWAKYAQAIECYQKSWEITISLTESKLPTIAINPLGDLGRVYTCLGEYKLAIESIKKGLNIRLM